MAKPNIPFALFAVAAGFLALGLYLEARPQGEYVIELREDGFYPSSISVPQGAEITFRSALERSFWPASNIHPAHGLYPEFDPERPIGKDKTWSFVFAKSGTWEFHDHLAPSFTGTIVVRDEKGGVQVADDCQEDSRDYHCWLRDLRGALAQGGINAAFERMAQLYEEDETFASSCHSLAHDLGLAAYPYFLKDESSILTPKAAFCASGFYHGFMEALLTTTRSVEDAQEFCALVEEAVVPFSPDAALQCYHGVGHGAMDLTVSMADANERRSEQELLEPALVFCREASSDELQLYRCASGVFNSLANFYVKSEFGLEVNWQDPLWICRTQAEDLQESCFGNMNTVLFWAAKGDFLQAASWVKDMEDEQAMPTIRYLAGLAALDVARGSHGQAVLLCRELQAPLTTACVEGFAHGFLEHGLPDREYEEALEFCETSLMSVQERDTCLSYVLSNLSGWYSKERAQGICEGFSSEYRSYCRQERENSQRDF